MQILVSNAPTETLLFGLALGALFLYSFVKKQNYTPLQLTQELKGFAILAIICAHIGYALSSNPEFLFPFSILAGVSVNLFLFLSGYGLTFSQIKKSETPRVFYKRRLSKLFIPFWIVLGIFLVLDVALLNVTYSPTFLLQSFAGIFNHATMLTDFNSPLWYFSYIFFYYATFPLLFNKKRPWITALFLYGLVWTIVELNPPFLRGVIGLYEVHMLAFPLGICSAWYVSLKKNWFDHITHIYKKYHPYTYFLTLATILVFIGYFALHAHIGGLAYIEEMTSLCIMFAIVLLFVLKKRESKLFSVFGLFSYEIYLFHWPLLLRYDFLYRHLDAWVATMLYLGVFILLAIPLQKVSTAIAKKI